MDETPATRAEAERALRAHVERMDARLSELAAELDGLRVARAHESADDEHDPEGVTLSSEWSRLSGLHEDALRERAELAHAQERLAAGGYGRCADCAAEIPAARLAVRPMATRCVACAERAGR